VLNTMLFAAAAAVALLTTAAALLFFRYPVASFAWLNRRALRAAGFTKHTVHAAAGAQTYFAAGQGKVVVLLHGAGDQAGTWAKTAPTLAANYRVVVPDIAGHGESAPARGGIGFEAMLAGIDAVLAAESPAEPVTLVGNSLGAWLSMWYAAHHPARIGRVVLVNGGAVRAEDRMQVTLMPATREEARVLCDRILDSHSPRVPVFMLDDLIRRAREGPIARLAQAWTEADKYLLDDRLRELSVPVDLLWGESDRLVPLELALRMQAALPAVRLTTIPRCGHIPQQEASAAFRDALAHLLASPPPAANAHAADASR
jgi:pimeloyl-ACP methyl ester carboxylesterase